MEGPPIHVIRIYALSSLQYEYAWLVHPHGPVLMFISNHGMKQDVFNGPFTVTR